MKNTRSICLLLLVVTTISVSALCAQSQADSLKFKPYWELNIDLLPIIKQNIVPVMSVGFRRPFQQRNGLIKAFRGRIGIDYLYDYSHAPKLFRPENSYFYDLKLNTYLSLGLDWQKNFQKWEYYYGVELINSFDYKKHLVSSVPDDNGISIDYLDDYTYKVGIGGMAGIRRRISDRFLLGLESSVQTGFNYRYVFGEDLYTNTITGSTGAISTTNGEDFTGYMNLRPIYTLSLIYQFKKRSKNEKNTVFNNGSH